MKRKEESVIPILKGMEMNTNNSTFVFLEALHGGNITILLHKIECFIHLIIHDNLTCVDYHETH